MRTQHMPPQVSKTTRAGQDPTTPCMRVIWRNVQTKGGLLLEGLADAITGNLKMSTIRQRNGASQLTRWLKHFPISWYNTPLWWIFGRYPFVLQTTTSHVSIPPNQNDTMAKYKKMIQEDCIQKIQPRKRWCVMACVFKRDARWSV